MGTVMTLDLFDDATPSMSSLVPIIEEALAVLHRADAMFSTWKDKSCISRIRRGELSLENAPAQVKTVLEQCREARSNVLRRANVGGALVNAAGDIASFGGPREGERFRIGVVDPANPRQLACIVETPGAIATSGAYERGEHLIDPHSRVPTTRAASATVVGPELGLADALATALVVAGAQALTMFSELSEYEGLVIAKDSTFRMTPGFPIAKKLATRPDESIRETL